MYFPLLDPALLLPPNRSPPNPESPGKTFRDRSPGGRQSPGLGWREVRPMVIHLESRRNLRIHLVNRVPAVGMTSWRRKGLSHPTLSLDGIRTRQPPSKGPLESGGSWAWDNLYVCLLSRPRVSQKALSWGGWVGTQRFWLPPPHQYLLMQ